MIGRDATRIRERTSGIQCASRKGQGQNRTIHARTQSRPGTPIPFSDVSRGHIANDAKIACDINMSGVVCDGGSDLPVYARQPTEADPVNVLSKEVFSQTNCRELANDSRECLHLRSLSNARD